MMTSPPLGYSKPSTSTVSSLPSRPAVAAGPSSTASRTRTPRVSDGSSCASASSPRTEVALTPSHGYVYAPSSMSEGTMRFAKSMGTDRPTPELEPVAG